MSEMSMIPKAANAELKPKSSVGASSEPKLKTHEEVKPAKIEEKEKVVAEHLPKQEEEVGTEADPNTGISFPVKLEDGKQLNCVGLRKKSMPGFSMKIYSFGIYADNKKMRDLLESSFGDSLQKKPTEEMYRKVIDSDLEITVRYVLLLPRIPVALMRRPDTELGEAIKKLGGSKEDRELNKRMISNISDNMKLTHGSLVETTRLPGYALRTIVKGELVSEIKSEILCRAYFYMYLGDNPFDKDAKEKFGNSMVKLP